MSDYRASIDIPQPREDVFAYLSDFSTTSEWDLGVVEAKRLNGQAVGEGTEFSTRGGRCRRQGRFGTSTARQPMVISRPYRRTSTSNSKRSIGGAAACQVIP
jgi:Polyketide cyclase / dehydrase and lipid transport